MQQSHASDLHLSADCAPVLRINGLLEPAKHRPLSTEEVQLLLYEVLTDSQIQMFEEEGELDCAYSLPGVARFRINIYKKYPGLAGAFRIIPHHIPTLEELQFPRILQIMLKQRSGLLLVTGPTNSGKSTTQAAMVNFLNENMNYHVITLEDPLEFIHENKNSLINQRQIGTHSKTFASALRAALREDPNVILVGEMRDLETISLAVTAAELGLLVLGTLHTKSAAQTISRIVDVFPVDQQPQVRLTLSEVLVGICSQQLLRRMDGQGRIAALEILVGNHAVNNLIREGKSHQVNDVIMAGKKVGMQLLDAHLKELMTQRIVTAEEAARYAADPVAVLAHGKLIARKSALPAV
jgi:twitching motility protein PilT